jgi:hypothetical protein
MGLILWIGVVYGIASDPFLMSQFIRFLLLTHLEKLDKILCTGWPATIYW